MVKLCDIKYNVCTMFFFIENLQYFQSLSKLQIYSNIINLNTTNQWDDMVQTLSNNRNHSVNGIFLDYDCEKSEEIIEEAIFFTFID